VAIVPRAVWEGAQTPPAVMCFSEGVRMCGGINYYAILCEHVLWIQAFRSLTLISIFHLGWWLSSNMAIL